MDVAYVRYAVGLDFLSAQPIQFVRIPCAGELIFLPPTLYRVSDVVHFWDEQGRPVVELRVAPATNDAMVATNPLPSIPT